MSDRFVMIEWPNGVHEKCLVIEETENMLRISTATVQFNRDESITFQRLSADVFDGSQWEVIASDRTNPERREYARIFRHCDLLWTKPKRKRSALNDTV